MLSSRVASVADTVRSYGPFRVKVSGQENLHGESAQVTSGACWSFMVSVTFLGALSRGLSLTTLPLMVTDEESRAGSARGWSMVITASAQADGAGDSVRTASTTAAA